MFCILLSTCKDEVVPLNVDTVSAVVQDDGSVLLTGKLNSDGGISGVSVGFGYGTNVVPNDSEIVIENLSLKNKIFTSQINDLDENRQYYFRALARNGNNIVQGRLLSLENIKAKPVVAPCNPGINIVDHNGNSKASVKGISTVELPIGWSISFSAGNFVYKINFPERPKTGIYSTVEDFIPEGKAVYIHISDKLDESVVDMGAKVYVNKTGANKWNIVVCEAPFTLLIKNKLTLNMDVVE